MQTMLKEFNQRCNPGGKLSFIESSKDIPFEIKRVYYLYDVKCRRGFHAHKSLQQYLICVNGSCKILLDDGKERKEITLDNPNVGLYIGPSNWREMYDFSNGAVLLVLASEYYDESDYIRDYGEFIKYLKEKENKNESSVC